MNLVGNNRILLNNMERIEKSNENREMQSGGKRYKHFNLVTAEMNCS